MSYILLVIYTIILCWVIYKLDFFKSTHFHNTIPVLVFLSKFIGGILVYLIYAKYYGDRYSSDIFKYFDDGVIIHSAIYENPWDYLRMVTGIGSHAPHLNQYYYTCYFWIKPFNYGLFNDNLTIIRFNAIVRLFSMGNIHIHTLIMSFISFTGLWAIFKVFENTFNKYKWLLLGTVFFIPSLYFWSSGVLKEGILMFAFGIMLYNFGKLMQTNLRFKHIIGFTFAVFLLLISKFYVLVAALPGLLFLLLVRKSKKLLELKFALAHLILLLFAWFTKPIIGVSFPEILAQKQHDFINFINSLNDVGSKINIPIIEPHLLSILKASPNAIFNALFRPTLLEANNAMMLMAGLENTIISIALLLMLVFFSRKMINQPWLWFCLSFFIILFTLSGLTTPVLGALVRYKAPALPFLGLVIMYLTDIDKIIRLRKRLIPF